MTSCFFWRKYNAKAGFLLTYLIIIIFTKNPFEPVYCWQEQLSGGLIMAWFCYYIKYIFALSSEKL